MNKKGFLLTVSMLVFSLALIFAGCSAGDDDRNTDLANEIIDTITNTVADNLADGVVIPAVDTDKEVFAEGGIEDKIISEVTDFVIFEDKLYAVYNGGIIEYDFNDKTQSVKRTGERFNCVEAHLGQIFVGGDYLYQMIEGDPVRIEDQIDGRVTSLYSDGRELMIGTDFGLYSQGIDGLSKIFEDVTVTSMVSDGSGLWIGTDGSGLYRYDGEKFKQRYLLRDTSIFSYVNCLTFNHNHLYVGTPHGIHVYNGGSWLTLGEAEGLPTDNVNSIDASGWVVYVATDKGVVSYFNNEIQPVTKLHDRQVSVIGKRGNQLIAASDHDGILAKSGGIVSTLVQPVADLAITTLSLLQW